MPKLEISSAGTHFQTTDGEPFFWLADTAWNAPLRATKDDWLTYLDTRKEQGFTAIQFVTTPWRGCRTPVHGRLFEMKNNRPVFNDTAWTEMEEWISLIAERGMVPVPVMIWDNNPDDDFFRWSEETCIEVGKAMVSKWSEYDPVWFLAGDGDYRSAEQIRRWKNIGRGIFGDDGRDLVTMHPCGCSWVGDIFKDESWYSFIGIQSGHGTVDHDLNFLLNGPYSRRWSDIKKPFLNIEANYEFATSYVEEVSLDAYYVRRASYWSLLAAPMAGITYGNNNIWVWAKEDGEFAEGHGTGWAADRWDKGLRTPGIESLGIMKSVLDELPWYRMVPADYLLAQQPGWNDPNLTVKAGAVPDLSCILVYLPGGGSVSFTREDISSYSEINWINPVTGERSQCTYSSDKSGESPTEEDWLLLLRR